jgi:hypothetical protein
VGKGVSESRMREIRLSGCCLSVTLLNRTSSSLIGAWFRHDLQQCRGSKHGQLLSITLMGSAESVDLAMLEQWMGP